MEDIAGESADESGRSAGVVKRAVDAAWSDDSWSTVRACSEPLAVELETEGLR